MPRRDGAGARLNAASTCGRTALPQRLDPPIGRSLRRCGVLVRRHESITVGRLAPGVGGERAVDLSRLPGMGHLDAERRGGREALHPAGQPSLRHRQRAVPMRPRIDCGSAVSRFDHRRALREEDVQPPRRDAAPRGGAPHPIRKPGRGRTPAPAAPPRNAASTRCPRTAPGARPSCDRPRSVASSALSAVDSSAIVRSPQYVRVVAAAVKLGWAPSKR